MFYLLSTAKTKQFPWTNSLYSEGLRQSIIASFIRSTNDSKWLLCSPPGTLTLEIMSFPCIRNLVSSP